MRVVRQRVECPRDSPRELPLRGENRRAVLISVYRRDHLSAAVGELDILATHKWQGIVLETGLGELLGLGA